MGVNFHMQIARRTGLTVLVACLCISLGTRAEAQNPGPDVIVGDVTGPSNYGSGGGSTFAYALGTTSCNLGTQVLVWIANTPQHPVISQNVFRIKNDRFEHIGQAWLKHGFTALQGSVCSTSCVPNPNGNALGLNCSDPYSSGLNGQQGGLGPKFEVNAATGTFPYPFTSPSIPGTIGRRLQLAAADIDPSLNTGAVYIGEGHYIHPDDAAVGNDNNNASYRRVQFAAGTLSMSFVGTTQRTKPGVVAWQDIDPTVQITNIDIPNDGRMILAQKNVNLGGGLTRYEFALHNLSSDRCAAGFTVNLNAGSPPTNLYFHDVPYHSGEPFDGTDWFAHAYSSSVEFRCPQTFAQNPNANALRWGTTYTFSFVSASATTGVRVDLFKPGSPSFMTVGTVPALLDFEFSTSGGGTGDLHIGVNNIPAAATEGYCVYSLDTTPGATGTVFGLKPDINTLLCLIQPKAPGSILHWSWPVTGVFPDVDIDLPAGSIPLPMNTKLDALTFVLGSSLNLEGVSPVVRVTF